MTKQEVVHEVFGHAHDARKQYVPKAVPSKNLTDKEIGYVEQGLEMKAGDMMQLSNGTNATMGPRDQTRQEVVHEVFGHAHDAKKQYVPKAPTGFEKNMTAKEMGIEGVPD